MNSKLNLNDSLVETCRNLAYEIVSATLVQISNKTTKSVERTIVRLLGVDGVNEDDIPYPNLLIDHIAERGEMSKGVCYWLGNAMLHTGKKAQEIAELINNEQIDIFGLPEKDISEIKDFMFALCRISIKKIEEKKAEKEKLRQNWGENPPPHAYVLTATGNVYEDVIHAVANARYGADIIAVIRSTAQSLLDYVPYGPTTEGYGGTYATQENFKIMRDALNTWGEENKRYVRLSSFCSGLCMPEIAAMGALEGLDNMANDALYGILYRDINMTRTFIDQKFSRMINGFSGTVINTGEDNYLRTADAVEAAHSVVASQLINYYFAKSAGMKDEFIAIGNAYEISPDVKNGFLLEWAQALLTRELFSHCKTKYMPPTKHMNGNIFRTHAFDTMFNLITIATKQDIQTIGVPTEGFYTPLIQDRTVSLENVKTVFNNANALFDEISFKEDGIINQRANEVLNKTHLLLQEIHSIGMFKAIENGYFGDVKRSPDQGKGLDGIYHQSPEYFNPFESLMIGDIKDAY